MRAGGTIVASALLVAASLGLTPPPARAASLDDLPVVPVAQRFSASVGPDDGSTDCLAASTAMVLEYFENSGQIPRAMPLSYAAVAKAYRQIEPGATDLNPVNTPTVVTEFVGSLLTVTEGYPPGGGTQWQTWVSSEIAAGAPVIADIPNWLKLSPPDHPTAEAGYSIPHGHAIVISGLHDGQVFYEDPWDGKEWHLPIAEFGAAWGPLYGAITFSVATGQTPPVPTAAAPTVAPTVPPTPVPPAAAKPPAPSVTAAPGASRSAPPGGMWMSPPNDLIINSNYILYFAAVAYPSIAGGPPVSRVVFTLWWPAIGPQSGPWRTACIATAPRAGDVFSCWANLWARGVPNGPFRVSFDVYDQSGNYRLSPNGERTVYQQVAPGTTSGTPTPVPTPVPTPAGNACLPLATPWNLTWTPIQGSSDFYFNWSWMYPQNPTACWPLSYQIYVNGQLAVTATSGPVRFPDITDLGIQYGNVFPVCLSVTATDAAGYTSPRSAPLCPD